MFRKLFISLIFVVVLGFAAETALFAQYAPVSGKVELQKPDGTREPVAGALIEVYRVDIKAGFPSAKTNSKGEFNFAGLQFGATYLFSISAPGCAPTTFPNVKAGQEKLLITMFPGDGSKFTEEEARRAATASAAASGTTELTAEQKKELAAIEAKNKEIIAKNEKILKTNEIIAQSLKEGNDAFTAKNYDLAIVKYEEGIAADPDFVGSVPILSNNRSAALRARGIDSYNKGVKSAEPSEKAEHFTKARQDLAESAQGYLRSWTILINASPTDINDRNNYENNKRGTLTGALETFRMAVRTEQVDQRTLDAAKVLISAFLSTESESSKQTEASLIHADLYRVIGDAENAILGYKAILETSPDNLDALIGAGLSLVNLGYINNDKSKFQEGANYLQKYASLAPDSHKFKADAVALLDMLKRDQNVTPQKVTTTRKRN